MIEEATGGLEEMRMLEAIVKVIRMRDLRES